MEYPYIDDIIRLGGFPPYQRETVLGYIEEVLEDLVASGVVITVAYSKKAKGTVLRGVLDLWNYTSGEVKFYPVYERRKIQLSYDSDEKTELEKMMALNQALIKEVEGKA